jgi:hypothetical protein
MFSLSLFFNTILATTLMSNDLPLSDVYSMHSSFLLTSVSTYLASKDFCIETPEDQFLNKICRVYKDNKGLCLTEIYLFTY